MIQWVIGEVTYTLTYDAENRLVGYSGGTGQFAITASFLYDADGNRVQETVNGVTIKSVGGQFCSLNIASLDYLEYLIRLIDTVPGIAGDFTKQPGLYKFFNVIASRFKGDPQRIRSLSDG
jgi:YD repeat-containing protein